MNGLFLCAMISSTKKTPVTFSSKERLEGLISFCVERSWDFEVVFN